MSRLRRVVTGHDSKGRSVIASDTEIESQTVPGMPAVELTTLWGSDEPMHYPDAGTLPDFSQWFAPVGGFRMVEFIVQPDSSAAADPVPVARDEIDARFPGLMDTMDPDVPGMHRSNTIDLLYVMSGRIVLELDDGSRTELGSGDVAVQSGTMHAWRNPYDEPCRVLGVIVGAHMAV